MYVWFSVGCPSPPHGGLSSPSPAVVWGVCSSVYSVYSVQSVYSVLEEWGGERAYYRTRPHVYPVLRPRANASVAIVINYMITYIYITNDMHILQEPYSSRPDSG